MSGWEQKLYNFQGPWFCVESSDDFQYQTAIGPSKNIKVSSNSGETWNDREQARNWNALSISRNGRVQLALDNNSLIYKSDDWGLNWYSFYGPYYGSYVSCIKISGDGSVVLIGIANGPIHIFKNNMWSVYQNYKNWSCIDCSDNGMYQAALVNGNDYIYITNNYGVNWMEKYNINMNNWLKISMSENGQHMAVINLNNLYLSNDYGFSFITDYSLQPNNWKSIHISKSGQKRVLTTQSGDIYIYNGDNWIAQNLNDMWLYCFIIDNGSVLASSYNKFWSKKGLLMPTSPVINSYHKEAYYVMVYFSQNTTQGIINYRYSIDNNWYFFNPPQTTSPVLINNLSPGTTYNIGLQVVLNGGVLGHYSTPYIYQVTTKYILENSIISLGNKQIDTWQTGELDVYYNQPKFDGLVISSYQYILNNTLYDIIGTENNYFTITGLVEGTTYDIRVKTTSSSPEVMYSYSNTITFTASRPSLIKPPLSLSVLEQSYYYVNISFTPQSSEYMGNYKTLNYQYRLDNGEWIDTGSESPIKIDNLINYKQYGLNLRHVAKGGVVENYAIKYSDPSDQIQIITKRAPSKPYKPVILKYTSKSYDAIIYINQNINVEYLTGDMSSYFKYEYYLNNTLSEYIPIYITNSDENKNLFETYGITYAIVSENSKNLTLSITNLSVNTTYNLILKTTLIYDGLILESDLTEIYSFRTKKLATPPVLNTYEEEKINFTQEDFEIISKYYVSIDENSFVEVEHTQTSLILNKLWLTYGEKSTNIKSKTKDIYGNMSTESNILTIKTPIKPNKTNITDYNSGDSKIIISISEKYNLSNINFVRLAFEYNRVGYDNFDIWTEISEDNILLSNISNTENKYNMTFKIDNLINGYDNLIDIRTVSYYLNNVKYISDYISQIYCQPRGKPYNPPKIDNISILNMNFRINFTPGNNFNNYPITQYDYSYDNGLTFRTLDVYNISNNIIDIELSKTSKLSLRSRNNYGVSSFTSYDIPLNIITTYPPNKPKDLKIINEDENSITLSFTNPYNGGKNILNYQYSLDNGQTYIDFIPPFIKSPITIKNITRFKKYQLKIRAINSIGYGLESDSFDILLLLRPKELVITNIKFQDI